MAGVTLLPTTQDVAGMVEIAANPLALMEPTSAGLGPATTARIPAHAKTTVAVTAPVTPLTLATAGAMPLRTIQDVVGMVEIAVSPHVLTALTRVALWDTPVTTRMHAKTCLLYTSPSPRDS